MPKVSKKNTRNLSRKMIGGDLITPQMMVTLEDISSYNEEKHGHLAEYVKGLNKNFISLAAFKECLIKQPEFGNKLFKNGSSYYGKHKTCVRGKFGELLAPLGTLLNHPAYPNDGDPEQSREKLSEDQISWKNDDPYPSKEDYMKQKRSPEIDFVDTDDTYLDEGWAKQKLSELKSYEEMIIIDTTCNRPVNPMGRTGIKGRGALGQWGCNYAADPIIFFIKDGFVQTIMVKRTQDTGQWAIPGGMVDPGDDVSITCLKEFLEECGGLKEGDIKNKLAAVNGPAAVANPKKVQIMTEYLVGIERGEFVEAAKRLLGDGSLGKGQMGEIVYKGYVDDPRNTDNSWMETSASLFFLNSDSDDYNTLVSDLRPSPEGDPGAKKLTPEFIKDGENDITIYASHSDLLRDALIKLYSSSKLKPEEKPIVEDLLRDAYSIYVNEEAAEEARRERIKDENKEQMERQIESYLKVNIGGVKSKRRQTKRRSTKRRPTKRRRHTKRRSTKRKRLTKKKKTYKKKTNKKRR
tara:strand:- start:2098 stop:3660 length:1563 start_codon:yes stop_codon:yes gene_type:complete